MTTKSNDNFYLEPDWEALDTLTGDFINEPELLLEMKSLSNTSIEKSEDNKYGFT